jgi:hypothetical protein
MKFTFGDYVIVKSGFYKGIKAHVTDYKKFPLDNCYDDYYIDTFVPIGSFSTNHVNVWINEKELEKVEE